jgi:hypothetical protein
MNWSLRDFEVYPDPLDGYAAFAFKAPYHQYFVDRIKAEVPSRSRQWNPSTKAWTVRAGMVPKVCKIVREVYGVDVNPAYNPKWAEIKAEEWPNAGDIFEDRETSWPPPPPPTPKRPTAKTSEAHAELHLLSSAPWPVVKAAYKAMAILCHPDQGGSSEEMAKLNATFAELKKRYGEE